MRQCLRQTVAHHRLSIILTDAIADIMLMLPGCALSWKCRPYTKEDFSGACYSIFFRMPLLSPPVARVRHSGFSLMEVADGVQAVTVRYTETCQSQEPNSIRLAPPARQSSRRPESNDDGHASKRPRRVECRTSPGHTLYEYCIISHLSVTHLSHLATQFIAADFKRVCIRALANISQI